MRFATVHSAPGTPVGSARKMQKTIHIRPRRLDSAPDAHDAYSGDAIYHPKLLNLGRLRGRILRAPCTHKKQQSGAARNIRNHCEMGGLRSFGEEQRELLRNSQISIRKQTNQNPHVIPRCFLTKKLWAPMKFQTFPSVWAQI